MRKFFFLGIHSICICYRMLQSLKSIQYIKQADIYLSEISLDSRASNDCNFHCSWKLDRTRKSYLQALLNIIVLKRKKNVSNSTYQVQVFKTIIYICFSTFRKIFLILVYAYFSFFCYGITESSCGKYIYYLNMADILVFGVRHYSI